MSAIKLSFNHDLQARVVRVAAILAERYINPDVAAYGRSRGYGRHRAGRYITPPSSKRREHFWFTVGRALTAAYSRRGCPTCYEIAVRKAIDEARADLANAPNGAAA